MSPWLHSQKPHSQCELKGQPPIHWFLRTPIGPNSGRRPTCSHSPCHPCRPCRPYRRRTWGCSCTSCSGTGYTWTNASLTLEVMLPAAPTYGMPPWSWRCRPPPGRRPPGTPPRYRGPAPSWRCPSWAASRRIRHLPALLPGPWSPPLHLREDVI